MKATVMNAFAVPQYVLRDGLQVSGPLLVQDPNVSGSAHAIFGFSDKPVYDRFITQATRLLTPYPLVKGFLRNQIEESSVDLRLVILDAEHPMQPIFHATTMQSLLDSLQNEQTSIQATHKLSLDVASSSFQATSIENDIQR